MNRKLTKDEITRFHTLLGTYNQAPDLTPDDVAFLCDVLNNPSMRNYEFLLLGAQISGVIARSAPNNNEAAKSILEYIQRDDSEIFKNTRSVLPEMLKCWTIEELGWIGGDEVSSILKTFYNMEYEESPIKDWIDKTAQKFGKEGRITILEQCANHAAVGLAFTGNPDNIGMIKESYTNILKKLSKYNGEGGLRGAKYEFTPEEKHDINIYLNLCSALTIKDMIGKIGKEGYWKLGVYTNDRYMDMYETYSDKYDVLYYACDPPKKNH